MCHEFEPALGVFGWAALEPALCPVPGVGGGRPSAASRVVLRGLISFPVWSLFPPWMEAFATF